MWPQWLLLAVAIGSCAVLTHAGVCSDPLSSQDDQTGGMRGRYIRIEPRAVTLCEGLQGGGQRVRTGGEGHNCFPACTQAS
jgi:hypothetical protein